MSEQFTPRTLAIVAVASLVTGFVVVFGGGMLALQQPAAPTPATVPSAQPPAAVLADVPTAAPAIDPGTSPLAVPMADDSDAGAAVLQGVTAPVTEGDDAGVAGGGVTVTVASGVISRCFEQTTPAITLGPQCDALTALDQHFQSHSAQIAACGRGHGHLAFIMDFRFSTSFVRAWGGPTSTIPNAGVVAACVRRVTAPMPLAGMTHAHDRYITAYGIDW